LIGVNAEDADDTVPKEVAGLDGRKGILVTGQKGQKTKIVFDRDLILRITDVGRSWDLGGMTRFDNAESATLSAGAYCIIVGNSQKSKLSSTSINEKLASTSFWLPA
jgi:hypothetical protein